MSSLMTIGDFSRAVRMSAKALRFYHQNGLLAPAVIDETNGYRLYAPEQIADAQIVRTLRGLDVPIDSIRVVLGTPDVDDRARLMAEHLATMEKKLEETLRAVQALRDMLAETEPGIDIAHRSVPEMRVAAIQDEVALEDLGRWFRASVCDLTAIAARAAAGTTGTFGGVWPNALFADGRGTATVYLEVKPGFDHDALGASARIVELPPAELAVAVHDGSDDTVPRVYAALGEYVARHELGVDAPVRETYLEGFPGIDARAVTEIGWPIFRVAR